MRNADVTEFSLLRTLHWTHVFVIVYERHNLQTLLPLLPPTNTQPTQRVGMFSRKREKLVLLLKNI